MKGKIVPNTVPNTLLNDFVDFGIDLGIANRVALSALNRMSTIADCISAGGILIYIPFDKEELAKIRHVAVLFDPVTTDGVEKFPAVIFSEQDAEITWLRTTTTGCAMLGGAFLETSGAFVAESLPTGWGGIVHNGTVITPQRLTRVASNRLLFFLFSARRS